MGRINPDHGASLTIKPSPKSETALHFMQKYFEENCDYLPTSDVWHLPSSSSKADVFQEMQQTLHARGQVCCTMTNFVKLWRQQFPQVKIPKVHTSTNASLGFLVIKTISYKINIFTKRSPWIRESYTIWCSSNRSTGSNYL